MKGHDKSVGFPLRRMGALVLTAVLACSLSFPQLAFAVVRVDDVELVQGENAVGGGKATLVDSALDMIGVAAGELYTDENLDVNFDSGNKIESVTVDGSAEVELSFAGENEVEEVHAAGLSNVAINANGHNVFGEVSAFEKSSITVNVEGENSFGLIGGFDDANITIRGTSCQRNDIVSLGAGEDAAMLLVERGALVIDHATVNLECKEAYVGSEEGNVVIDTSKIGKGDGNEYAYITAGGTMEVTESVIDITGTVHSKGKMTINHSDMKVELPDSKFYDTSPYRVFSETGIELIREENGAVEKGVYDESDVWYVDTGDGDDVALEADGEPVNHNCGKTVTSMVAAPGTGDGNNPFLPIAAAFASAATAAFAARRREEE